MKRHKTKLFLLAVITSFALGTLIEVPGLSAAEDDGADGTVDQQHYEDRAECIGDLLAQYMNKVISGTKDKVNHTQLLSPAFNMTSNYEVSMFNAMIKYGANFDGLDGFAGNVYTINGKSAYAFYQDHGWKRGFDQYGKYTVFTEFGDFAIGALTGSERVSRIQIMKSEFDTTAADNHVEAIVYFAPLISPYINNAESFKQHIITEDEYRTITANNTSKAGVNSGFPVDPSGGFADLINSVNGKWSVQIVFNPGEVESAAATANAMIDRGIKPVFRFCVDKQSCPFEEPETLIKFILDLDSRVNGTVYVLTGPNEPYTENWMAEECGEDEIEERKDWEVVWVPCSETIDPQFHSLRPYPGSPCNPLPDESLALFCANDLIVQESYDLYLSETEGNFPCDVHSDGSADCTITVFSSASVAIDFDSMELPILGNTELVPNSLNSQSVLNFEQRVNNYVSWYLNGIVQRAEEKYFRIPDNSYELINLSGPIRKLYPREVQTDLRYDQVEDANYALTGREFPTRHDQIFVCTKGNPVECYRGKESKRIFLSEVSNPEKSNSEDKNTYPYIPYSNTEDAVGSFETLLRFSPPIDTGTAIVKKIVYTPTNDNPERYVSFPHSLEDDQLGWQLQQTYIPEKYADKGTAVGDPRLSTSHEAFANPFGYCEVEEARTNPGDRIYSNFLNESEENVTGILQYEAEFKCQFPAPEPDGDCVDACEGDEACEDSCPVDDPKCNAVIHIPMSVQTNTPRADNIWGRLVDGGMSVFRRIFPRVDETGPLDEIKDIPAKSTGTYASTNLGSSLEVSGTATLAGKPTMGRLGGSAQVFFPHYGSVHDYFLKGIQLALRPKGFGEISFTDEYTESQTDPECGDFSAEDLDAILPTASSECSTSASCASYPGIAIAALQSESLRKIFASAATAYKVPMSVLVATFFNEGGFNPGKYDLSDEGVLAMSGPNCSIPNCSISNVSSTGAMGPWQFIPAFWGQLSSASVNAGVNDGRTPNICNLLDSTFAAAKALSIGRGGATSYTPPYDKYPNCANGVTYNTGAGPSTSCNWNSRDVVTASRQYLGYCEEPDRTEQTYKPRQTCINNPNTCYQRSVLSISQCGL